jgi:hypothetical protein
VCGIVGEHIVAAMKDVGLKAIASISYNLGFCKYEVVDVAVLIV